MRGVGFLLPFCLMAPSARAEGSTYCLYMLLTETHAMTRGCGNPLDIAGEARYAALLAGVAGYIEANSAGKPGVKAGLERYDSQAQERYAHPDAKVCQGPDYSGFRQMLGSFTSEEGSRKIQAGLLKPGDPFKGDCL